ncbi:MAG: redox-sensing transcriptional repressor Rex [Anaerolineae bacterium]|jgi:redox-sensing transcriptional repressor|nr:redox-sensing transcriptional repressor Rex [Anaerolineae bacterium]
MANNLKPPPPDIVIGRLPLYLRALDLLAHENKEVTSSYELGERLGISSAQIRKDLSHFGDFGKQGTGYQINFLIEQLQNILKVNRRWPVVIIGAGHVGLALANYRGFEEHGFEIVGMFDSDPAKIGQDISGIRIRPDSELLSVIRQHNVRIAMIATPASAAQQSADMIIEAGVRAILSYAPITLNVPPDVHVQYIDPVTKLQHMTYYLED